MTRLSTQLGIFLCGSRQGATLYHKHKFSCSDLGMDSTRILQLVRVSSSRLLTFWKRHCLLPMGWHHCTSCWSNSGSRRAADLGGTISSITAVCVCVILYERTNLLKKRQHSGVETTQSQIQVQPSNFDDLKADHQSVNSAKTGGQNSTAGLGIRQSTSCSRVS